MNITGQRIGVDVGGTFTDFVVLDAYRLTVYKVSTVPEDQSQAILHGMEVLQVDAKASVMHGTTIATNALLERRGARTALITTRGFADVLAIGRQNRPQLYEFSPSAGSPLIPRSLRFEVDERIDHKGAIQKDLDVSAFRELVQVLKQKRIESVAVTLLFSFLNNVHEYLIASLLEEELPGVPFSLSVDLLPEYREYERTSTTVVNAYVRPLVMRYLTHLERMLQNRTLKVMQSSGGILDAEQAALQPARLVLSGPAGGVVGAFTLAKHALASTKPKIMTLDMGGTSTDVALCPGRIPQTTESAICNIPLRLSTTQIHTVGAGGGSLARVDAGGVLRVGPQSAGAVPGPVCYGQGGKIPTVTDANLVLGRLIPSQFLGGKSSRILDVELARKAIATLGESIGFSVEETALGILRVANATMERALRRVSVECGYDPRSHVLIPFGGAGPLHACEIARLLGIPKILIPRYPGVLSAFGLLMADITSDASRALLLPLEELIANPRHLQVIVNELETIVLSRLDSEVAQLDCSIDLRYLGQSYELTIPIGLPATAKNIDAAGKAFHVAHHERYGYSMPEHSVESVAVRLQASIVQSQKIAHSNTNARNNSPFQLGDAPRTPVYFTAEEPSAIPLLSRDLLYEGCTFDGPALIVQYDSTIVITAGWSVMVDELENLHLSWIHNDD